MGCGASSRSKYAPSPESSTAAQDDDLLGHRFRGLSVSYLATTFLAEVRGAGLDPSATVYEAEPKVIRPKGEDRTCPRDGRPGAAYVDCVGKGTGAGLASLMLSYTWGYTVGDIADSLRQFSKDHAMHEDRTYVWMCCLCINQHRVREAVAKQEIVPFEVFRREFQDRVCGIGHIVAMMSPWRDPGYIHRVWCNFEMFTALDMEEPRCRVDIVMPSTEASSLESALLVGSGLDEVWQSLADVRVEHALASVDKDRQNILGMIREPPGPGYHKLNSTIAKHLQAWVVRSASKCLERRLDAGSLESELAAKLCAHVGELLVRVGLLERARVVLEQGKSLCEGTGSLETSLGARLLRQIAILRRECGDLEQADEALRQAREILERIGNLRSAEGASLLSSIGFIRYEQGQVSTALQLYMEARAIRELTGTLQSTDGAMLMRNIGAAKQQSGDLEGAEEAFKEAKAAHEHLGTFATPAGALLLTGMGTVRRERGDLDGALAFYTQAQWLREQTGTLETPYGADLLRLLGIVRREEGDVAAALALYEQAKAIRIRTATLETPDGASLITSLGYARFELGEPGAALELFAEARRIREAAGTFQSPDGALLCRNVGVVRSAQGDLGGALKAFGEATHLLEELRATKTPLGACVLASLGVARSACGEPQAALQLLLQAREIREETRTMDTAYGRQLEELIASAQAGQADVGALGAPRFSEH